MNLYLAGGAGGSGGVTGPCKRELELDSLWKRRLWTYCYVKGVFELKIKLKKREHKIDLFLDSGAFSAFTQKVVIDIQEYIAFIKEYKDIFSVYANLDVIGDAAGTLKNQRIMEKAGLKPLPCFHYGDDEKYLKTYMEEPDYIAFGGMVPIANADLAKWLDHLFSKFICGKDGIPTHKIHGFGLTSVPLVLRYPWFSVDSTSWVMTSRMGSVYVPRIRDGKYIYDENIWKVCVSSQSPTTSDVGAHITTLPSGQRKVITEYFDHLGFKLGKSKFKVEHEDHELVDGEKWNGKAKNGRRSVEVIEERGLSNDYHLRDELNVRFFMDFEKSIQPWPWAFRRKGITGFGLV